MVFQLDVDFDSEIVFEYCLRFGHDEVAALAIAKVHDYVDVAVGASPSGGSGSGQRNAIDAKAAKRRLSSRYPGEDIVIDQRTPEYSRFTTLFYHGHGRRHLG